MKIPTSNNKNINSINKFALDTNSKNNFFTESSLNSPDFNTKMNGFAGSNGNARSMEDINTNFIKNFPILTSPENVNLQTTNFPLQKLEVCSINDIPNWTIKEISIENGVIKNMNDLDLNRCTFRLLWDFADLYQIASKLGKNIDHVNGGNDFADVPFFCISCDDDSFEASNVYLIRVLDRTIFMKFFLQLSFWTNMGREGILEKYSVEKQEESSTNISNNSFPNINCACLFEGAVSKNNNSWFDCDMSISNDCNFFKFKFEDSSLNFIIDVREILESEISALNPSLSQNSDKLLSIKLLPELRKLYHLKDMDWFDEMNIPSDVIIKFANYYNFLKIFFVLKQNSMKEILTDNINKGNHLRLNHNIKLNIIEAEMNNMNLYTSPIYIEVCIYDKVFAKTNNVESTYGQLFWREEFNLNFELNLSNIVLKLKLENSNTVIGYVDIGSSFIYNNRFKVTGKELKLPILHFSPDGSNYKKPIGELLVTLKHNWNFVLPTVQYYAIMDIFKQINVEYLVEYIYKDNKIDSDAVLFEIGKSILNILSFYGREDEYLNQCIEKEINDTIDVLILRKTIKSDAENPNNNHIFNSLFRGNSLVTKMLEYHFNKSGGEYIFQIFEPILKKICSDNLNLEMDPKRLKKNIKAMNNDDEMLEEILENHYHKICEYLNEIWNSIYNTSMDLPQNIKLQLKFIRTSLELFSVHGLDEKQLRSLVVNCISSFIFLRFFIPIILNPKLFNIMNDSPNETQRRTLTLVSKILLNISTQTMFEIKDPFLSRFNSFISSKREEVFNYYDKITEKVLDFTNKKYDFLVWRNDASLVNKFENESIELQCSNLIDFIIENDLNSKNFVNENKFLYDVKSLVYKKDVVLDMPKILQARDLLNSPIDEMSDFTFSKRLRNNRQTVYAIGELSFENEFKKNNKDDFSENMFELLGLKDANQNQYNSDISDIDEEEDKNNKHTTFEENLLNVELTQLFSECHILYSKKIRILKSFQMKEIYRKNLKDFVASTLIPNLVYDVNTKIVSMSDSETILKSNRKDSRLVFQNTANTELILGNYVLYGEKKDTTVSNSEMSKNKPFKNSKLNKNGNGSGMLSRSLSKFFCKK